MGIASGDDEDCFRGTLEGFLFPVATLSTLNQSLPSHTGRLGLGNQAPEGAEAATAAFGCAGCVEVLVSARPAQQRSLEPSKLRILNCVHTEGLSRFTLSWSLKSHWDSSSSRGSFR